MLNPSTPLPEQDDELREQVADALRTGYHEIAETKVINRVMELITADRKRVELEARIDELSNAQDELFKGAKMTWFTDRRVELKAQQEEV